MLVNTQFDKRTIVHASKIDWVPSPLSGVDRRMLDRIGAEAGHATSIVRYAPASNFSPHVHDGGEEFFVLDGVFQDEHGDFPAGTYVRNPPQSHHTPRSDDGCTIFVKLWQFDADDRHQMSVNTNIKEFVVDTNQKSSKIIPLYKDSREDVRLEKWQPDASVILDAPDGMEILVLAGGFREAGDTFETHSWLRLPCGYTGTAIAGKNGARLWVKRDHLALTPTFP